MRKAILFSVAAMLLLSCSAPESMEQFVRRADSENGVYPFELDFSDSLSTFDISFYVRTDISALKASRTASLKLDTRWYNPSDSLVLEESVYIPSGDQRGERLLYREGVNPDERGLWRLEVKTNEVPSEFRGIGIICKRNGTR